MVTGRDRAQLHLKCVSLRLRISVVGYKGQKTISLVPNSF